MPRQPHESEPLLPWSGLPKSPPSPPTPPQRLTVITAGSRDAATFTVALQQRGTRNLEVLFGDSRSQPVQLSHRQGRLRLRLHRLFAFCPDDVIDALAAWVARGRAARAACVRLDEWIEHGLALLPVRQRPAPAPQPKGAVHDLAALSAPLLASEALRDLTAHPVLFWGRPGAPARRSLQLGLYDPEHHSVRIHPVLDHDTVPTFFVTTVLFHELLHAAMPPHKDERGRWVKHSAAFRARERAYPDYERAERWLDQHISRLIKLARQLAIPAGLR
jgi:hypothetical protein